MSDQHEPNDVLDQTEKMAVLADEYGISKDTIRAAIRHHRDIAERVDDAPDTDIQELQSRLACFAIGEYQQYVQECETA